MDFFVTATTKASEHCSLHKLNILCGRFIILSSISWNRLNISMRQYSLDNCLLTETILFTVWFSHRNSGTPNSLLANWTVSLRQLRGVRSYFLWGSEWEYFDSTIHLFFWMYNFKQLIFSHFNTNIKKFVLTFFFPINKQTTS